MTAKEVKEYAKALKNFAKEVMSDETGTTDVLLKDLGLHKESIKIIDKRKKK